MYDPPGDSADQAAAETGILVLPFRQQEVITITVIPKVGKGGRIQLMVRIDLENPFGAERQGKAIAAKNGGTMTRVELGDNPDRRIVNPFQQPETVVRRSVIDKDHLIGNISLLKERLPIAKKRYQVVLFIVDGNDNGQCRTIGHGLTGLVEECPSRKYPAPGRSSGAYRSTCNPPGVR